jgi:hypothetical protein
VHCHLQVSPPKQAFHPSHRKWHGPTVQSVQGVLATARLPVGSTVDAAAHLWRDFTRPSASGKTTSV